jgi:hypothetical protein
MTREFTPFEKVLRILKDRDTGVSSEELRKAVEVADNRRFEWRQLISTMREELLIEGDASFLAITSRGIFYERGFSG